MLEFKIDSASERIILTLTELTTIPEPIYEFNFTHTVTKDVVSFSKIPDDDFSNYQNRYNEFEISPISIFGSYQVGEWHYVVTEQQTGIILEFGKLILNRGIDFAFTKYNTSTSFKTYNG